jgi:hypothetical protein
MTAYITYQDADTYFESRLHTVAWDESTSTEKTTALAEATMRIERLRFSGELVDADQELEFPRYYGDEADGTEEIPDDIKYACCEIAMALLDGVDPDQELEGRAIVSQAYSSVRITKNPNVPQDHIAAGIPSLTAWRYLMPYLASSRAIKIYRV